MISQPHNNQAVPKSLHQLPHLSASVQPQQAQTAAIYKVSARGQACGLVAECEGSLPRLAFGLDGVFLAPQLGAAMALGVAEAAAVAVIVCALFLAHQRRGRRREASRPAASGGQAAIPSPFPFYRCRGSPPGFMFGGMCGRVPGVLVPAGVHADWRCWSGEWEARMA